MTYPNTLRGLRNIRVGVMISLIAAVLIVPALILAALFSNSAKGLFAVVLLLFTLIPVCLLITAKITTLVGVWQASREIHRFLTAFAAELLLLVLSVLFFFLALYQPLVQLLILLIEYALNAAATVLLIRSIMELPSSDLKYRGKKLILLYLVLTVLSVSVALLASLTPPEAAVVILRTILLIVSLILSIVWIVRYLSYLKNAIELPSGMQTPLAPQESL